MFTSIREIDLNIRNSGSNSNPIIIIHRPNQHHWLHEVIAFPEHLSPVSESTIHFLNNITQLHAPMDAQYASLRINCTTHIITFNFNLGLICGNSLRHEPCLRHSNCFACHTKHNNEYTFRLYTFLRKYLISTLVRCRFFVPCSQFACKTVVMFSN